MGPGARQHRLEKQLLRYWTSQNPAAAQTKRRPGLSLLLAPSTLAPGSCLLCLPSQPRRARLREQGVWESWGVRGDHPLAALAVGLGSPKKPELHQSKALRRAGSAREIQKCSDGKADINHFGFLALLRMLHLGVVKHASSLQDWN